MAATVIINRLTGAGPTKTNITSTTNRASTSDSAAPGTSNPIPVPAAGSNYSYWVSTQLEVTVTPAGTINNIRWYTDGGNGLGTGVTMVVATANSYVQATGTPGDTGDELTEVNHGDLDAAPVDAFGLTSGSPLTVAGSISNPSVGDLGDIVVYQIQVASTAGPGTTPSEVITWAYDET